MGYIGGIEWPEGVEGKGVGLTGLGGSVVCGWCGFVCWCWL